MNDAPSDTKISHALKVQVPWENIHFPLIEDTSEKGIIKTAIRMSLTRKKRMEMLVGVQRPGFR